MKQDVLLKKISLYHKSGAFILFLAIVYSLIYFFAFDSHQFMGTSDDFLSLMNHDVPLWERFWRGYSQANGRVGALIVFAFCNIPTKILNLSPFQIPWGVLYWINFLLMSLGSALCYIFIKKILNKNFHSFDYLIYSLFFFMTLGSPWVIKDYFRWHVLLQDYAIPFFLLFFTPYYIAKNENYNKKYFFIVLFSAFFSASSNENTLAAIGVMGFFIIVYYLRIQQDSIKKTVERCLPFALGYLLALIGFLASPGQWKRKELTVVLPFSKENFLIPFIYTPSKVALSFFNYAGISNSNKYFIFPGLISFLFLIYFFIKPQKLNKVIAVFGIFQLAAFAACWTRLFTFYFPLRTTFLSGFLFFASFIVIGCFILDQLYLVLIKYKKALFFFYISCLLPVSYFTFLRIGDGFVSLSENSSLGKIRYLIFSKMLDHYEIDKLYIKNCPQDIESFWGLNNFKKWVGLSLDSQAFIVDTVNYDKYGLRNFIGNMEDYAKLYTKIELRRITEGPRLPLDLTRYKITDCKKIYPKFHRKIDGLQIFPVSKTVDYSSEMPKVEFEYIVDQMGDICHFSLLKEEVYNSVPKMEELIGFDVNIKKFEKVIVNKRFDMGISSVKTSLIQNDYSINSLPDDYHFSKNRVFPQILTLNEKTIKYRITISNVITENPLYGLSVKMLCNN